MHPTIQKTWYWFPLIPKTPIYFLMLLILKLQLTMPYFFRGNASNCNMNCTLSINWYLDCHQFIMYPLIWSILSLFFEWILLEVDFFCDFSPPPPHKSLEMQDFGGKMRIKDASWSQFFFPFLDFLVYLSTQLSWFIGNFMSWFETFSLIFKLNHSLIPQLR